MFVGPQLVGSGEPGQRLVLPPGVVAVNQIEAGWVQDEEATVDQPLISRGLLHEARDHLSIHLQCTEPSGRLHSRNGRQTPMPSVERNGSRDVYVGQAVSVRQAELVFAPDIVSYPLQAPTCECAVAGVNQRDPPRLSSLLAHVDRVVFEVEGDVGHVERVVGEILLDHITAVPTADDEVIYAVSRVDLHDVPQHRLTTDLDHWLWYGMGFL